MNETHDRFAGGVVVQPLNTNTSTASSAAHPVGAAFPESTTMAVFKQIRESLEFHARQRRILSELRTLSDRELDDLNLSRAQLEDVSREAARSA